VLEKDGEDLDRSCKKIKCYVKSGADIYFAKNKKRKASWTDHILRKNRVLRRVIKTEGVIEVMGRQGRRHK
jgi:hypothetical protein